MAACNWTIQRVPSVSNIHLPIPMPSIHHFDYMTALNGLEPACTVRGRVVFTRPSEVAPNEYV